MARLQSDPPEAVGRVPQNLQQGCRFARYLHFLHDSARVIHNADAGLLDRYVQSAKMVHAALLLLMLEAVTTDLVFTISLKRSTQNLQLSTSWAGRLHHLFGRYEGKSGRRGYRCYRVRILYATIRATMLTKISSAERDFRIIGLVEWR